MTASALRNAGVVVALSGLGCAVCANFLVDRLVPSFSPDALIFGGVAVSLAGSAMVFRAERNLSVADKQLADLRVKRFLASSTMRWGVIVWIGIFALVSFVPPVFGVEREVFSGYVSPLLFLFMVFVSLGANRARYRE